MILQNTPYNIVIIKSVHKKRKGNLLSENVFQTQGDKCLHKYYQKLMASGRTTENIHRFEVFFFLSLFYMFHEDRDYVCLVHYWVPSEQHSVQHIVDN